MLDVGDVQRRPGTGGNYGHVVLLAFDCKIINFSKINKTIVGLFVNVKARYKETTWCNILYDK